MHQPLPAGAAPSTPTFYLTRRQPIRPGAILLATVAAIFALSSVVYALGHNGRAHPAADNPSASRSSATGPASTNKDDPNQIDTIVLGDPADAPTPARHGDHVSDVHPFVIVHLPRWGEEAGLIPDTPAGRLLYSWLAAFNHANYPALGSALPSVALAPSTAAQIELREQTGGFALLSAKEVAPGVLVFRLRDQTTQTEVLGTLQLRPNSNPASIASFSLRAVPAPTPNAAPPTPPHA